MFYFGTLILFFKSNYLNSSFFFFFNYLSKQNNLILFRSKSTFDNRTWQKVLSHSFHLEHIPYLSNQKQSRSEPAELYFCPETDYNRVNISMFEVRIMHNLFTCLNNQIFTSGTKTYFPNDKK